MFVGGVLAACGPVVESDPAAGEGSGGEPGEGGSGDGGLDGGETQPAATPACDPTLIVDEEEPWHSTLEGIIRAVQGGYELEFADFDSSDEEFGCGVDPPCVYRDGRHTRVHLSGARGGPPAPHQYPATAVQMSERECGCCNGEGGEPDSWDRTAFFDEARVIIDGADEACVNGHWFYTEDSETPQAFVVWWCR